MELRECPFCGVKLEYNSDLCGFLHPEEVIKDCVSGGILVNVNDYGLWNTRASDATIKELVEALDAAARSLRTIERGAGKKEEYLDDFLQVRGYAGNRAMVAETALAKYKNPSEHQ